MPAPAGFEVLVGRCLDLVGTELPYQPFADALRSLGRQLPFVAGRSQLRVFEQTLALLDNVAAGAPVLLVLEDVHWADTSTLDLVAYLAHNVGERRVLLISSYRADELASEARVRRLADSVRRSGAALLLELVSAPPPDELAALIGSPARATAPALVLDAIAARSEGTRPSPRRSWPPRATRPASSPAACATCSCDAWRAWTAGRRACCGWRPPPDATSVTGCCAPRRRSASATCASRCAAPSSSASSSPLRAGPFRFRHALLAEAIYATLLPGEREELHARLADELARGEPPASAAELAPHWAAAGRAREGLVASIEAAREAEAVFGLAEALAHLERALALWADVTDAAQLAGLDLAEPRGLGRGASRPHGCGAARRRARPAGHRGPRRRRSGARRAPVCGARPPLAVRGPPRRRGGRVRARRRTRAACATLAGARTGAGGARESVLMLTWRHEESRAFCEQALALAHAVGPRAAEVPGAGHARSRPRLPRPRRRGAHNSPAGGRSGRGARAPPEDLDRAYIWLTDVLTLLGRPRESARLVAEAVEVLRRYGIEHGPLLANLVQALVAAGDWEDADRVSAAALRANTANWPQQRVHHACRARGRPWRLRRRAGAPRGRAGHRARGRARLAGSTTPSRPSSPFGKAAGRTLKRPCAGSVTGAGARRRRLSRTAVRAGPACAGRVGGAGPRPRSRRRPPPPPRPGAEAPHRRAPSRDRGRAVTPNANGWRALAEAESARPRGQARPEAWTEAATIWEQLERPPLAAYCHWRQAEALAATAPRPRDRPAEGGARRRQRTSERDPCCASWSCSRSAHNSTSCRWVPGRGARRNLRRPARADATRRKC